jgi:hypothetical protein
VRQTRRRRERDHVAIKQLIEDFGRYLYLPRLKEPAVPYAGHLFEATGTTPALAWVINAIVDALAEFGVRHA